VSAKGSPGRITLRPPSAVSERRHHDRQEKAITTTTLFAYDWRAISWKRPTLPASGPRTTLAERRAPAMITPGRQGDHRTSPGSSTTTRHPQALTTIPERRSGRRTTNRTAPSPSTRTRQEPSEGNCNLRFPGQYYDAETGWHYNWHRYYDPKIGGTCRLILLAANSPSTHTQGTIPSQRSTREACTLMMYTSIGPTTGHIRGWIG